MLLLVRVELAKLFDEMTSFKNKKSRYGIEIEDLKLDLYVFEQDDKVIQFDYLDYADGYVVKILELLRLGQTKAKAVIGWYPPGHGIGYPAPGYNFEPEDKEEHIIVIDHIGPITSMEYSEGINKIRVVVRKYKI